MMLPRMYIVLCLLMHNSACEETFSTICPETRIFTDTYEYQSTEVITINCTLQSHNQSDDMYPIYIQHIATETDIVQNISISSVTHDTVLAYVNASTLPTRNRFFCKYGHCPVPSGGKQSVRVNTPFSYPLLTSARQEDVECVWYYSEDRIECNLTCFNVCRPWVLKYEEVQSISSRSDEIKCCNTNTASLDSSCPVSFDPSCIIDKPAEDETYQMYLWTFGKQTNNSNFTLSVNSSIMQLGAVSLSTITPDVQKLHIVHMSLEVSPVYASGIICSISYTSEWEPSHVKQMQITYTATTKMVNASIKDLEPYTEYNLEVVCRPVPSKYWSRPTNATGRTLAEPPIKLPTFFTYSDVPTDVSGLRNIIIYWKRVEKRFQYGHDTKYSVTLVSDEKEQSITQWFPADVARINVSVSSNCPCTMLIGGRNEKGHSLESEEFSIGAYREDIHSMKVVVDELALSIWSVSLYHDPDVNPIPTSRTNVFWCQVDYGHTSPPICQSDIESTISTAITGELVNVTLPHPKEGLVWSFGVSLDSSATVWSHCSFFYKNHDDDEDKPLQVVAVRSSTNRLNIEVYLSFDYCQLSRKPLWYQCGLVEDSVDVPCHESDMNNVTATPFLRNFTMEDDLGTDIKLCFRPVYDTNKQVKFKEFPVTDNPEPKFITTKVSDEKWVIVGVAVTVAIFVAIGVVIGCYKLKRRLSVKYPIQDVIIDLKLPDPNWLPAPDSMRKDESNLHVWCDITQQAFNENQDISAEESNLSEESFHLKTTPKLELMLSSSTDPESLERTRLLSDGYTPVGDNLDMHNDDTVNVDKKAEHLNSGDTQNGYTPLNTILNTKSTAGTPTSHGLSSDATDCSAKCYSFTTTESSQNGVGTHEMTASRSENSDVVNNNPSPPDMNTTYVMFNPLQSDINTSSCSESSDVVNNNPVPSDTNTAYVKFSHGASGRAPSSQASSPDADSTVSSSQSPIPFYIQADNVIASNRKPNITFAQSPESLYVSSTLASKQSIPSAPLTNATTSLDNAPTNSVECQSDVRGANNPAMATGYVSHSTLISP